jgi:integrase
MVFTFARIGAALRMNVDDVQLRGRRLWVRLLEKGGRLHEMPCHHILEEFLEAYLRAISSSGTKAPLFQSASKDRSSLSGRRLQHSNAYQTVQKRCRAAGIGSEVCCHSFRATGITTYLENGGAIERAAVMANHTSIRTTQLYDRRDDRITLDEVERIIF